MLEGLSRTGRLINCAAIILFLAFASLASAPITHIKVLATGLGLGILVDATIIRGLLVPSVVVILGEANWWMPEGLARSCASRPERLAPSGHVASIDTPMTQVSVEGGNYQIVTRADGSSHIASPAVTSNAS